MTFDILFRIEPADWEAARQAAVQYHDAGQTAQPDWETIPHGTYVLVTRRSPLDAESVTPPLDDGRATPSYHDPETRGFHSAGADIRRGINFFPLDFAVWLATLVQELRPGFRGEASYAPVWHDFTLSFSFDDDTVAIASSDRASTPIRVPRAIWTEGIQRSLQALVANIVKRAPGVLAWSAFDALTEYIVPPLNRPALPITQALDWSQAMDGRSRPPANNHFSIEWSLDDGCWPRLENVRGGIAPGSAEDAAGTLFPTASGHIRFMGGSSSDIPRGYSYTPSDWIMRSYHPDHRPHLTLFERGFHGSVFAFAEFFGWLLEVDRFGIGSGVSFRDYLDPVHGFRLRFVHEGDARMVSILSDRFIDRGYRLRVPSDTLRSAAIAFLSSVHAAIRERAPALADLVSFRYVRPPSGR